MMAADDVIRWTTTLAVLGVAAVAAVASYEHGYDLVRAHGESGWTTHVVPLTVDGLIYASSMCVNGVPDTPRGLVVGNYGCAIYMSTGVIGGVDGQRHLDVQGDWLRPDGQLEPGKVAAGPSVVR